MGTGWLWFLLSALAACGAAVPLDPERSRWKRSEGGRSDLFRSHKEVAGSDQRASVVATNTAVEKETEKLSNKQQDTKTPLHNSHELLNPPVSQNGPQSATSLQFSSSSKPGSKQLQKNGGSLTEAESTGSDPSAPKLPSSNSGIKISREPEEEITNSGGIDSQNSVPDSQSNTKDSKKKEESSDPNKKAQSGVSDQDTSPKLEPPESNNVEEKAESNIDKEEKTTFEEKEAENPAPDSAVLDANAKDSKKKEESSDQNKKAQAGVSDHDTSHNLEPPESNNVEEKAESNIDKEEKTTFEEKEAENPAPDSAVQHANTKVSKKEESSDQNKKAQSGVSDHDTSHNVEPPESNNVEEEKAESNKDKEEKITFEEKEAENPAPDSAVLHANTKDSKKKGESSVHNQEASDSHKLDVPESNKVDEEKANSEEEEAKEESETGVSNGLDDGTKKNEKYLEGIPKNGSENSHFFAYLVTTAIIVAALYIAYHNKRKIIAFALEGKKAKLTRRPKSSDYQRLDQKI